MGRDRADWWPPLCHPALAPWTLLPSQWGLHAGRERRVPGLPVSSAFAGRMMDDLGCSGPIMVSHLTSEDTVQLCLKKVND